MGSAHLDIQPSIDEVYEAQRGMKGTVLRTPLVRLNIDCPNIEIFLKLENLHPVGSFKFRNACSSFNQLPEGTKSVYTVSTGNFARATAWFAKQRGIKCTILVPDHAPKTKTDAVEKLGAKVIRMEHKAWWEVISCRKEYENGHELGVFLHPEFDRHVIAGNGTVALEILEDLPDVNTIIVPYGGGALTSGVGTVIKALKPSIKVITSEVDTSPQVYESLKAGKAVPCRYTANFCDGIGGRGCFPPVWAVAGKVVDDTIVCTTRQIADAIKILAESNRVVAEGAAASSVASALSAQDKLSGKVVCIITGGNIDTSKFLQALEGHIPI